MKINHFDLTMVIFHRHKNMLLKHVYNENEYSKMIIISP